MDSDGEEGDMHLGEELDEEELERDLAGESPNDEDEAVMERTRLGAERMLIQHPSP